MRHSLQEDRIVAAGLILLTAGYWSDVEHLETLRSDDAVGPAGFPALIAILMFALAAKLLIWPETKKDWVKITDSTWLKWVLFVLYTIALPLLGFPASTLLFLIALFVLLKIKWYKTISTAVTGAIVIYAIFGILLNLRLPMTPWG